MKTVKLTDEECKEVCNGLDLQLEYLYDEVPYTEELERKTVKQRIKACEALYARIKTQEDDK